MPGVEADVGDLWDSQAHEQALSSLELVDGYEVGVGLSAVVGLPIVFRNAVYARGGVIGVLVPSSCFRIKSAKPGSGLSAETEAEVDKADSSEGKVELVMGVVISSFGLVVEGAMVPGKGSIYSQCPKDQENDSEHWWVGGAAENGLTAEGKPCKKERELGWS